jgi:lysyl-tRNA synthetase class 1
VVRRAFELISDIPSRLLCFSDDMDGLRKVPTNVPNQERMREDLGLPLTKVRDPFDEYPSFGEHNNARLRAVLDGFGFEYEFLSATECYRAGRFNEVLRRVLERHEAIRQAVLPTLGPERRETYSPILPVCPDSGRVLQVPILSTDPAAGTVSITNTGVPGSTCWTAWMTWATAPSSL